MKPETRWICDYCGACYAEYINGCPRCYMGEPGTATSVRQILAIQVDGKWIEVKNPADAG